MTNKQIKPFFKKEKGVTFQSATFFNYNNESFLTQITC